MTVPSATPVFDLESSLRRMGYDRQLFREMVGLLNEDGPRRLGDILQGVEEHNCARISHAAHSLKGLTANFSASRAVATAARVEHLARQGQWDEMEPAVADLDDALAELIASLQPVAEHESQSV